MIIPVPATAPKRIQSIDILRGAVMVIMALDHCRDYFSDYTFNPTDLQHASTAMFLTRWVTHFCAPVFIFLSGTSAFLSARKATSKKETAYRLLTRGLWLVVLEVTLVYTGWTFEIVHHEVVLQVIWALGCCMVFLSALVFLPWQAILAISLLMIFGHNALDGINPPAVGAGADLWHFLHIQGPIHFGAGLTVMVFYPLVPWLGVMAAGYCMGLLFTLPERQRNNSLYLIGIGTIVLFILLRFLNIYGDPAPWQPQPAWWRTLLSFVNCSKYPPSLLYLLMTLGPAITLLPILEKASGSAAKIFTVYGRVPLFYYVLHIYLLHGMAVVMDYFFRGNAPITLFVHPGYSLPLVYAFWLLAVLILYLPCRWFMRVKMNNRQWWLSYL